MQQIFPYVFHRSAGLISLSARRRSLSHRYLDARGGESRRAARRFSCIMHVLAGIARARTHIYTRGSFCRWVRARGPLINLPEKPGAHARAGVKVCARRVEGVCMRSHQRLLLLLFFLSREREREKERDFFQFERRSRARFFIAMRAFPSNYAP